MADTKVTSLAELTSAPDVADVLPLVDTSDTSMAGSGTTKKITPVNLMQTIRSTSLPAPAGLVASTSSGPGGNVGRLATATYYYVYTAVDADGNEFAKSAEANIAVTSPGWVTMTLNPSVPSSNVSNNVPGAYEYRLYRGTSTGAQDRYIVVRGNTSARDWGDAGEETLASPPSSGTLYDNALRRNGAGWFSGKSLMINQEWTTDAVNISAAIEAFVSSKQAGRVVDGHSGIRSTVRDRNDVTSVTITNAANNGSGLVRITATAHGYATGDRVSIYGITGSVNAAAHGLWGITRIDANTFDLVGSTFSGTYTSGGSASNAGLLYAGLFLAEPKVDRDQFVSPNLNGDDCVGVCVVNNGSAKATEAIYIGYNGNMATAFGAGVTVDAPSTDAFRVGVRTFTNLFRSFGATVTNGIDISTATISGYSLILPGNVKVNGAGTIIGQNQATPTLLNGNTGLVLRNDTNTPELFIDAQTGAANAAYFSMRGRTGSANVRGEISCGGGFGSYRLQTMTAHPMEFSYNNTLAMTLTDSRTLTTSDSTSAFKFSVGTTNGLQIGTSGTQKLGFFGITPAVRPSAFTQTFSTASHTHAAVTAVNPPAGGTGTAAGGYDTAANRNLMITSLTATIADVANVKQVLNGVIDDLQSIGLLQ